MAVHPKRRVNLSSLQPKILIHFISIELYLNFLGFSRQPRELSSPTKDLNLKEHLGLKRKRNYSD